MEVILVAVKLLRCNPQVLQLFQSLDAHVIQGQGPRPMLAEGTKGGLDQGMADRDDGTINSFEANRAEGLWLD